ncbi:MAG TPA: aminotransferase class V-fold PLP-dependent enzyme [Bryobacteraceae bacterium]|jgi:alanine-glyoxylate transaminase/serine-glyoxylate transaminase/serine-pyruvate transaminase
MTYRAGRHFLQIPGPTNVPDRILRAIDRATIDHRSGEFGELGAECLVGLKAIFQTESPVIIYPSSATGAWEAALVNTLNAGDRVLAFETGHFANLWAKVASNLGLSVDLIPGDWRRGVDAEQIAEKLTNDPNHRIQAVMVVHNETSTGVTSNVPAVRRALDEAKHPALLIVDTVSSLGSIDYRHDEWGVDVAVGGSQKGMMLPPGLSFNALSPRALDANKRSTLPKSYWRWTEMLASNSKGFFPYTPATGLLYGLREAIRMLQEEGLACVFARHAGLADAARAAVRHWDLEMVAQNPSEYSNVVTALLLPDGFDERALRSLILQKFNMSLGSGLGKLAGHAFRIGHLGDFNELMLAGTLAGVEMGLALAGVPHRSGGVSAALEYLTRQAQ